MIGNNADDSKYITSVYCCSECIWADYSRYLRLFSYKPVSLFNYWRFSILYPIPLTFLI